MIPKRLGQSLLILAALLIPDAALGSIIRFDEVINQPVDGKTIAGVTYGFSFGGTPSQDAVYGVPFPSDALLQDYVLAGPASGTLDPFAAGLLTLTFTAPTKVLDFAVALVPPGRDFVSLLLYDANLNALGPEIIITNSNCDVADPSCSAPSEAEFVYTGSVAVKRISLDFRFSKGTQFAIDNLITDTPEPGSMSMSLFAGLGMLGAFQLRRRSGRTGL